MRKLLTIAALAAVLCAAPLAPPALAQAPSSGGGFNYRGADGKYYNNPASATAGVYMQGMSNMILLEQMKQATLRGARTIKAGRATTRFATRPWPTAYWMKNAAVDPSVPNASNRQVLATALREQRAEWARQMAARGANPNDMADMMALGTVMAVETYTGGKVSNAGFREQAKIWRPVFLRDAFYQGQSTADKQKFYEGKIFLNSTHGWWLRSAKGQTEAGRKWASQFLDTWNKNKTGAVVRQMAPYTSSVAAR